jgi:hypothetical protein
MLSMHRRTRIEPPTLTPHLTCRCPVTFAPMYMA